MPYLSDRTKDSTTTTGTGDVTLSGTAPTGFQTFAVGLGSSSVRIGYCIAGTTGEWEVGKGVFNGTTGLTRDTVRSSSNGNTLVNFSAGTKDVFVSTSAELLDNANTGMQYAMSRGFMTP
jgi:hypothetical protein